MVGDIRPVDHKAAGIHEKPSSIHHRQLIARSQFDDLFLVRSEKHVGELDDGACAPHLCKCAFEIAGIADRDDLQLESQNRRGELCLPDVFGVSRSSNRLPMRSASIRAKPVTLPPGRARLATIPVAMGSMAATNTIGIVRVAFLAATTGGVPDAMITSTLRWTSSAAASGSWSALPANPYSILIFWPSTYPNSRSPCRKAAHEGLGGQAVA
jgi:hypothetical protein